MALDNLLLVLVVIWVSAQVFGELAERLRQPAVIGELFAGVVIGIGGLGLVDPSEEILHLLAEIGVLILLFEIGLETRLENLLKVGGAAALVALTGVVLPFAAGYAAAIAVGQPPLLAVFLGATFTATSVGVTARVLRDLGRLQTPEAQIILGAAVIDDVVGLVLLTIVTGILAGAAFSVGGALWMLAVAAGFLAAALLLGRLLIPYVLGVVGGMRLQGALAPVAMALAFSLSLLALIAGSATIIGAFAAGLILSGTAQRREVEAQVRPIAHLFVPIFFVAVGAQVNLRLFNPLAPGALQLLGAVLGLSVLAVATKWVAGVAPFWLKVRKSVVGAGMIPRGEVGLIFAQVGQTSGLLGEEQFAVVVLVVMITTFLAPVLLRRLLGGDEAPRGPDASGRPGGVEELVTGVE